MKTEINGNDTCPCGSGKKYRKCCKKKEFKWVEDASGNLYRSIHLCEEVMEGLHRAEEEFIKIFGRKPAKEDPVFLEKYLISEFDLDQTLSDAMEAADIDPAIIYATQKTGLIVSSSNIRKLTDLELKQWNDAIAEYDSGAVSPDQLCLLVAALKENIKHLIIAYGLVLDKYVNDYDLTTDTLGFLIKFHITKTLKVLRAILTLLDNNMSDEVFALSRTMYESYIYLIFIAVNPVDAEKMLLANVGLETSAYQYPRREDGTIKTKKIAIKIESGEKIGLTVSNKDVLKNSPYKYDLEFYQMAYDLLSRYVHPNVSLFDHCFDMRKFDHFISIHKEDGILYANLIAIMLLNHLSIKVLKDEQLVQDMRHVICKTASLISQVLDSLASDDDKNIALETIRRRLSYF